MVSGHQNLGWHQNRAKGSHQIFMFSPWKYCYQCARHELNYIDYFVARRATHLSCLSAVLSIPLGIRVMSKQTVIKTKSSRREGPRWARLWRTTQSLLKVLGVECWDWEGITKSSERSSNSTQLSPIADGWIAGERIPACGSLLGEKIFMHLTHIHPLLWSPLHCCNRAFVSHFVIIPRVLCVQIHVSISQPRI